MIRGVLFDKDDTLLDLATFWRRPVQHTVAFMLHELGRDDDAPLRQALEAACGFDGDRLIPESPVVAGTNADVIAACMAVLAAPSKKLAIRTTRILLKSALPQRKMIRITLQSCC